MHDRRTIREHRAAGGTIRGIALDVGASRNAVRRALVPGARERYYRRSSTEDVELHAPTSGILLCTGKTGPTVRYALVGTRVPIAMADYQGLPEEARGVLPSAAELEAVIEDELEHRA